jgi:hypothetical protein
VGHNKQRRLAERGRGSWVRSADVVLVLNGLALALRPGIAAPAHMDFVASVGKSLVPTFAPTKSCSNIPPWFLPATENDNKPRDGKQVGKVSAAQKWKSRRFLDNISLSDTMRRDSDPLLED